MEWARATGRRRARDGLRLFTHGLGLAYATEAASDAIRAVFGVVAKVFATCTAYNLASRRVLEKAGMIFVGEHELFDSIADGYGLMPLFIAECSA